MGGRRHPFCFGRLGRKIMAIEDGESEDPFEELYKIHQDLVKKHKAMEEEKWKLERRVERLLEIIKELEEAK